MASNQLQIVNRVLRAIDDNEKINIVIEQPNYFRPGDVIRLLDDNVKFEPVSYRGRKFAAANKRRQTRWGR